MRSPRSRLKCLQIHRIERIGDDGSAFPAPRGLLGFDQERQSGEAAVVQQTAKGLLAQATAPDVLVAVDAAPARLLRIVPMKHLQTIDADDAIEGVECVPVARFADDVVARRDEMAGVKTDTDTGGVSQVPDDSRQVLEPMSERPALARRMLEEHQRPAAWPRLERLARSHRQSAEAHLLRCRQCRCQDG